MADDKKVAVFLSVIGRKTYSLLGDLIAPDLSQTKSFAELTDEPKPILIAEQFHFHWGNQALGESIAKYCAELRRLSTHCELGTYLDQALRNHLVCGYRQKAYGENC